MPFIPNHSDTCERKHAWETNCPFCRKRVIYIECTCAKPSKFYLDKDGDVRHNDNEHECGKMRTEAREFANTLWWKDPIAKQKPLRAWIHIGRWESGEHEHIVEQYKRFMREKVAELWIDKRRKEGDSDASILERIRQIEDKKPDDEIVKEFVDMVRWILNVRDFRISLFHQNPR